MPKVISQEFQCRTNFDDEFGGFMSVEATLEALDRIRKEIETLQDAGLKNLEGYFYRDGLTWTTDDPKSLDHGFVVDPESVEYEEDD